MPRYTNIAILLHWLIALLIIAAFLLGVTMVNIHGITPTKLKYFSWHKWVGVTVLTLACLRLLWRLFHQAPPYPVTMPTWQKKAASGLHGLLYVLMFAVPISGYFFTLSTGVPVVYLGIIPLPVLIDPNPEIKESLRLLHFSLNLTLFICICLHVLAALKHQFIDRDNVMKRMLPTRPSSSLKELP
jgi:cytochrome b561